MYGYTWYIYPSSSDEYQVEQKIWKLWMTLAIGLFKMFSRWIWGIFNIQIQSDRGHKLMLFMFQNKDKDLLGIYQYGCDPFCVSLLTDRHLKVRCNSILFTFSDKGALTSARDS